MRNAARLKMGYYPLPEIEANGVTPDVSMPWSFEEAESGADPQLLAAIDALRAPAG